MYAKVTCLVELHSTSESEEGRRFALSSEDSGEVFGPLTHAEGMALVMGLLKQVKAAFSDRVGK